MTWLRAQDGTLVNLDHVGCVRAGPESGRPGVHRVTVDLAGGPSVVLYEGDAHGAADITRGVESILKPLDLRAP